MSDDSQTEPHVPRIGAGGSGFFAHLKVGRQARAVLVVTALFLAIAVAVGGLSWYLALVGGLAAVAVAVATQAGEEVEQKRPPAVARNGVAAPAPDLSIEVCRHMPDPCIILDAEARVIFANDIASETLGEIAAGQPVSFFLRAPQVTEAVASVAAGGNPVVVTYLERVPLDRWFEAHVAPLPAEPVPPGGAGEPRVLIILRDLTEAQRIERMRADFVANASHELRTPLASLVGFIETLQGSAKEDPSARERFLTIMSQQCQRMSRLINDLMSLSRIELKAHVQPDTLIDLSGVVRQVTDALGPIADEAGVTLNVSMPETPLLVRGDHDEMTQVVQNLVENAIKYGHSGGHIDITGDAREADEADGRSRIALAVRDHGPGIAPEHLPRLTERFYRVDVAESREKGGTGLGLAIAKHILNRHRGRLDIVSEPGAGATFTVVMNGPPETPPFSRS